MNHYIFFLMYSYNFEQHKEKSKQCKLRIKNRDHCVHKMKYRRSTTTHTIVIPLSMLTHINGFAGSKIMQIKVLWYYKNYGYNPANVQETFIEHDKKL